MRSHTDASLVARVELVNLRSASTLEKAQDSLTTTVKALEQLSPLHGKVKSETMSTVCKIFEELQSWYAEWKDIHAGSCIQNNAVLAHLLDVELGYAQLWTVCVALRGCQWDKVSFEGTFTLTLATA